MTLRQEIQYILMGERDATRSATYFTLPNLLLLGLFYFVLNPNLTALDLLNFLEFSAFLFFFIFLIAVPHTLFMAMLIGWAWVRLPAAFIGLFFPRLKPKHILSWLAAFIWFAITERVLSSTLDTFSWRSYFVIIALALLQATIAYIATSKFWAMETPMKSNDKEWPKTLAFMIIASGFLVVTTPALVDSLSTLGDFIISFGVLMLVSSGLAAISSKMARTILRRLQINEISIHVYALTGFAIGGLLGFIFPNASGSIWGRLWQTLWMGAIVGAGMIASAIVMDELA